MADAGRLRRFAMLVAVAATALALLVPAAALAVPRPDPIPVVESLSTYAAPAGTIVSIYGRDFGAQKKNNWVTFGDTKVKFRSWTDTVVTFEVPTNAQPGYVGIAIEDDLYSNGLYFVPYALPVITAVSAQSARAGEYITITGTGFESAQGDGWVSFEGVPGTVVSWSSTSITVAVPAGAPVGYLGIVQHGLCSNGMLFVPFGMPTVAATSSQYVLAGEVVTITGLDFGATPDTVLVAGEPVPHDSWSDTEITFTMPASARSGYVGVVRGGITSNGIYTTVAPRVDAVSSWWVAPGAQLAITGAGFGDGSDGWACMNGEPVRALSWSENEVVIEVPADAVSGLVGIVRADWATSNGKYVVVAVPPHVDAVDVTRLVPGAPIVITGTGFGEPNPASYVTMAGAPCAVVSWTDTRIEITTPLDAQPGYLGVVREGLCSNGLWLQYESLVPVVTGLSNWWGPPGEPVTITGYGFGAAQGDSYPVFAGVPAEVVSWSDEAVVAIVPAGAGTGYAGIVRAGWCSNGLFFMPYEPPALTSASASTAIPGDVIVVEGRGLRDTPGLLTVGGVAVEASEWTETRVVFTVPTGVASGYIGITHDGICSNGIWLEIAQ